MTIRNTSIRSRITNTNIPDRTACIMGKGESPVPEMRKSADLLAAAGADFIIIGCEHGALFSAGTPAVSEDSGHQHHRGSGEVLR